MGLTLLEVGLRLSGYTHTYAYIYDPQLHYHLIPNFKGVHNIETYNPYTINSLGMRDEEIPVVKEKDEYRIAFLGDSTVEAVQVPLEATFVRLTGRALSKCEALKHKKIRTLNFGVGGYGTIEEILMLRHRVWQLKPDAIVLMITPANDLLDNLRREQAQVLDSKNYQPRSWAYTTTRRWAEYLSSKSVVAYLTLSGIKLGLAGYQGITDKKSLHPLAEDGIKDEVFLGLDKPPWPEAWKVTEELLHIFTHEVREHKIPLLFVTASHASQVHPNHALRKSFMTGIGVDNLFYPESRLAEIAQRLDVPFLALSPLLLKHVEQTKKALSGFGRAAWGTGHWNEAGHQLASRYIAEKFCSLNAIVYSLKNYPSN